jgi:hypothetical protein
MILLILFLAVLLNPWSALAAIRVYDPLLVSNCTSGNYSAGAHDCSGAIGENGYNTHTAAIAALVAGDTLRLRGGTHNIQLDFSTPNKTGTADAWITVEGYPGETAVLQYNNAAIKSYGAIRARGNRGYFIFQDFSIDGALMGDNSGWQIRDGNHHFILRRLNIYNQFYMGVQVTTGSTDITIVNNELHDMRSDCVSGNRHHGLYLHDGARLLVQGNHIYNTPGGGIQLYPGPWTDVALKDNYIVRSNTCSTSNAGGIVVGSDDLGPTGSINNTEVSGNVIAYTNQHPNGSLQGTAAGLRVYNNSSVNTVSGTKVWNNTIYKTFNTTSSTNNEYCMLIGTGALNTDIRNNVMTDCGGGSGTTTAYIDLGTGTTASYNACLSTENCPGTNKVTIASAAAVFNIPFAIDLTLLSGTNVLRDAGTAVSGRICNGTCDIGAYESFGFSTGVVTGTTAEVTLGMNRNTPVIPTADGWSLTCTPAPTACPSPVVTSAVLKTGTNSTVAVSWSGGACSAGQTWKVSYDPGAGGTTETGQFIPYQELNTITDQTLTNNCTGGGGGGPPGTPFLLYEFDDNLSDTSGNNLHITTSNGTSFVNAKHFRGLKTDSGQDDYAEMPYFSGVNPSTQSLTIAGGVFIDPTDVCNLKAVGGTPAGVNQYFHLYYSGCTWKIIVQDSAATATEFSVQSGWNHVCVNFNAATDTSTLHINGVAGSSSGSSLQTYTSFVFAGNFRIGRFSGSSLASGPNHIYDRWVVYQSVEDCGLIYENFEPPSTPYTGVINIVYGQLYMAKSYAGSPVQMAALSTNVTLPKGAAFAAAFQAHCTNAGDCSPVGQRPYYTCILCPSAGSELPVPDSASADGIELWGTVNEQGLLTGAYGANLSGSETHVSGGTHLTANSVTVVDLCQNCATVERWIFRLTSAAPDGAQYCVFPKEQGGASFDSYSPASGMCISIGQANANAGP